MRKYIIGFMVGASLMFAVQAGAATLLGSTVDGVIQVNVDGENMGQAPVIDGVSYLPVRKLGDKAGYKVGFGEGIATLTSIETTPEAIPEPSPATSNAVDVGTYTLETIIETIKMTTDSIKDLELSIKSSEYSGYEENAKALRERLEESKVHLEKLNALKVELEAQQ